MQCFECGADEGGRVYLGINKETLSVVNEDFKTEATNSTRLRGGFNYGQSRNGTIYIAPRPLINHGIHRCKFCPSSPTLDILTGLWQTSSKSLL